MQRYGQGTQDSVEEAMHRKNEGTLRSGKSGKKVTDRKQAIAIGLSEARKKGAKVPPPPEVGSGRSRTPTGRFKSGEGSSSRSTRGRSTKRK